MLNHHRDSSKVYMKCSTAENPYLTLISRNLCKPRNTVRQLNIYYRINALQAAGELWSGCNTIHMYSLKECFYVCVSDQSSSYKYKRNINSVLTLYPTRLIWDRWQLSNFDSRWKASSNSNFLPLYLGNNTIHSYAFFSFIT